MSIVLSKRSSDSVAKLGNQESKFVSIDYDAKTDTPFMRAPDGEQFSYLPYIPHNGRTALFISGVSGSGKSFFARDTIKLLRRKEFKNSLVYFITVKHITPGNLDPAFVEMAEEGYFKPLDIYGESFREIAFADFKNCIVVFDDYNQPTGDRELDKFIEALVKQLLELSRKQNVAVILINHLTQEYNKTRSIIYECDTYCLFPRANANSVKKFIKSYITDSADVLKLVSDLKGPLWTPLIIRKSAPSYIMSPKWFLVL